MAQKAISEKGEKNIPLEPLHKCNDQAVPCFRLMARQSASLKETVLANVAQCRLCKIRMGMVSLDVAHIEICLTRVSSTVRT